MNLQDIYRLAVCFAAISGALNYDTVIKLLSIYLKFLISNRLVVLINISYRDTEQTAFSAAFDYDMIFKSPSTLRLFDPLPSFRKIRSEHLRVLHRALDYRTSSGVKEAFDENKFPRRFQLQP